MSGFVSLAHARGAPVDAPLLERLTHFLAFRGPDAQHTWLSGPLDGPARVGLGHALLTSSNDTDPERQPASLDGRVWIVADARIDGRLELLARLRAAGRAVAGSAPDVELILHAYQAWGSGCLAHLLGDFAFVIWDAARQELFAARDQFGVTPFYYAEVGAGLLCSNTLACLRRHPQVPTERDEQTIGDTLILGYGLDQTATLFTGIRRLPPAHFLTWSGGRLHTQRYWSLPRYERYLDLARPEQYAEQFLLLWRQAVADRLRTERAAILMSGGLDSTAIAAVAAQALGLAGPPRLQAYTWVYDWLMPDEERHYAGLAAEALDIPISFLSAEAPLAAEAQALDGYATPVPVAFGHAQDRLSFLRQFAPQGRVMLAGTGGDIALYPESTYWLRRLGAGQLGGLWSDIQRHRQAFGRRPPVYIRDLARQAARQPLWMPKYPHWLDPDFVQRGQLKARLERFARNFQIGYNRTRIAASTWVLPFTRLDPGQTGFPVKVRHPFFDLRLLDFLFRVPAVPWFHKKYLLRSAMRGLLPEAVRLRRKQTALSWPMHALALRRGTPAWLERMAEGPELHGYADRAAILRVLRAPEQWTAAEYQLVVQALNLADLLRQETVLR